MDTSTLLFLRGVATLSLLLLLITVENLFPFRKKIDATLSHYTVNLAMMGVNALAMLPVSTIFIGYMATKGVGHISYPKSHLLQAFLFLFLFDGITYLLHRLSHLVPLLWRFHRVHHSDRDLNVTSASRFHIGELLLLTPVRWMLMILCGTPPVLVMLFEGVLVAAAQFGHSNFCLPKRWEERVRLIFVTPDLHRTHHSDKLHETNSNYGTIFSCWDRLFGTYQKMPEEKMVTGIKEYADKADQTFFRLLTMPFRD